jgi:hypothetical protein
MYKSKLTVEFFSSAVILFFSIDASSVLFFQMGNAFALSSVDDRFLRRLFVVGEATDRTAGGVFVFAHLARQAHSFML